MSRPEEELRRRDDLLQVLYWMRGEGLGDAGDPEGLARMLGDGSSPDTVRADLGVLAERGLVEEAASDRWGLTPRGLLEGGRRFADAFAGLTGQAHGECSDPDCGCHTDPEAAIECHIRRHVHAPIE